MVRCNPDALRKPALRSSPFNNLEKIMYRLDTPDEPWTMYSECVLEGQVDDARFAAALRHALTTHSMCRARMRSDASGKPQYVWEIPDQDEHWPLTICTAEDDDALQQRRLAFESEPVPLHVSPPLRVMLVHTPKGDRVLFLFNHILCDGMSMIRFMISIQSHYLGTPDDRLEFDEFAIRNAPQLLRSRSLVQFRNRLQTLSHYRRTLPSETLRIKRRCKAKPAPGSAVYGVELIPFSVDETRNLRKACNAPVMLNDLLLAGLALTIRRWNQRHDTELGPVGIMVPTDQRPREKWRRDAIANFSSGVVVSLPADAPDDLGEAARLLNQQSAELTRVDAAGYVMELMRLPLWLLILLGRWLLPPPREQTTVLTNLGKIPRQGLDMGDAGKVTEVYGAPPLPIRWRIGIGATIGNNRLFLAIRYHRSQFDQAAAAEFAAMYRQCLMTETVTD